mgnify:CR=1 FL=1
MKSDTEIAQQNAKEYWQKSETTFLVRNEYYERVEKIINSDVLDVVEDCKSMLDVGCGNGRFTLLFANVIDQIWACDLSKSLISSAKKSSDKQNISNVQFRVADIISQPEFNEKFEVLSCMGVLSTIVADADVDKVLDKLVSLIKPGGYLILRDTLSTKKTQSFLVKIPPAIYRSRRRYGSKLSKRGLVPVYCARVWFWEKNNRENFITVMRKPLSPFSNIKYRIWPQSIFNLAKKHHY